MAITIGSSNISSLQAQKSLGDATSKVAKAYQQLSSGLRINQASDDAAGLAIATQLNSKARVFNVAVRNVNDGVSISNIAEGALNSLKEISERQLELAEQSANGTYTATQRKTMNDESTRLTDEANRIVSSTSFNGINIFDPSAGKITIQAGIGANSTLSVSATDSIARNIGDGTFATGQSTNIAQGPDAVTTGDFNGDGRQDVATTNYDGTVSILLGNGDGSFNAQITVNAALAGIQIVTGDFNGDGKLDIAASGYGAHAVSVLLGNGDGRFKAVTQYATLGPSRPYGLTVGDFNGDGHLDLITSDDAATGTISFIQGNADGTFKSAVTSFSGGGQYKTVESGDIDGDGILDLVTGGYDNKITVFHGNGNGTFSAVATINTLDHVYGVALADFDGNGTLDISSVATGHNVASVYFGDGNGSFSTSVSLATSGAGWLVRAVDINGDGRSDIVASTPGSNSITTLLSNGNGTFQASVSSSVGASDRYFGIADFNGDGRNDVFINTSGTPNDLVLLGKGSSTATFAYNNLNTRQGALDALTNVTKNLDRISAQLGSIGASGSRFQTALNNLQVQSQNFQAAASRIQDADIAQESSVLVRTQILQQAAASVLAQANQQPALALKLLGG